MGVIRRIESPLRYGKGIPGIREAINSAELGVWYEWDVPKEIGVEDGKEWYVRQKMQAYRVRNQGRHWARVRGVGIETRSRGWYFRFRLVELKGVEEESKDGNLGKADWIDGPFAGEGG